MALAESTDKILTEMENKFQTKFTAAKKKITGQTAATDTANRSNVEFLAYVSIKTHDSESRGQEEAAMIHETKIM